jgi:hypothetical protein
MDHGALLHFVQGIQQVNRFHFAVGYRLVHGQLSERLENFSARTMSGLAVDRKVYNENAAKKSFLLRGNFSVELRSILSCLTILRMFDQEENQ